MAWNIADLTEHIVDTVPDRIALIVADEPRTYAQLEERANRLAHHLAGAGHRPRRPRRHLRHQQPRVRRDDLRGVQAARGSGERELPLRRGRAALPLRQRRSRRARCTTRSSRRASPRCATSLPMLRHLIAIDDGSGTDTSAIGSVDYEDALAGGEPGARLRRALRRRHLHPLHRRHHGHAEGRRVAPGRRAVRARRAGELRHRRAGAATSGSSPRPRPRRPTTPALGVVIAPLMHGAAQWGTINGLINGRTTVLTPKFDAHDVWRAVEKYQIPTLEHHRRRDGPPADRGARRRRIRRVVVGRGRVDRGGVQRDGEGAVPRAVPEPRHRRRGRLDRDRLQRRARDHEGRRGEAGPARPCRWAPTPSCSTTT